MLGFQQAVRLHTSPRLRLSARESAGGMETLWRRAGLPQSRSIAPAPAGARADERALRDSRYDSASVYFRLSTGLGSLRSGLPLWSSAPKRVYGAGPSLRERRAGVGYRGRLNSVRHRAPPARSGGDSSHVRGDPEVAGGDACGHRLLDHASALGDLRRRGQARSAASEAAAAQAPGARTGAAADAAARASASDTHHEARVLAHHLVEIVGARLERLDALI